MNNYKIKESKKASDADRGNLAISPHSISERPNQLTYDVYDLDSGYVIGQNLIFKDALLLASAPDLLEACKAITKFHIEKYGIEDVVRNNVDGEVVDLLEKAIAKAEVI